MSESLDTQGTQSQVPQNGGQAAQLGLLLRKAREARGLSIDDVVQALKFSRRQVEALEANDLAALPGHVFVRGSIRSYARFLKIDPEPLLDLLSQDVPVIQPDVRPPNNMGTASPKRGVHRMPPLVVLSVLLLVVAVGMVVWHLFGDRLNADTTSQSIANAVATTAAEPPASTTTPPPLLRSDSGLTSMAGTPTQPPAPVVLQTEQRTLAFTFRGKCWVEVKDASQMAIFTGQFDEGARQSVSGQPPFQIVLGSAANVDLAYDGQPIDLKPHTRAEVARLTLE